MLRHTPGIHCCTAPTSADICICIPVLWCCMPNHCLFIFFLQFFFLICFCFIYLLFCFKLYCLVRIWVFKCYLQQVNNITVSFGCILRGVGDFSLWRGSTLKKLVTCYPKAMWADLSSRKRMLLMYTVVCFILQWTLLLIDAIIWDS